MKRTKALLILACILMLTLTMALAGCGGEEPDDVTGGDNNEAGQTNGDANGEGNPEAEHAHGAYEWIGEYELKAGTYLFHFGASADATMDVGFIKMGDNITDIEHHAAHLMETDKEEIKQDSEFEAKPDYAYTFEMNEDHGHINFTIKEDGTYAIVTEHMPHESNMQIFDKDEVEILPMREHEGEAHQH
ncbi:MAG: hypothetical protein ACOX2Q_12705 [Dehalobacterium sp.]|jgi:hypothetical protein